MFTGRLNETTYPLLIDGGLSNALEALGYNLNQGLWTADVLAKHPEAIEEAHYSYLKAGARCIITSSYQASVTGLTKAGYNHKTAVSLIKRSVTLAEQAIRRYTHDYKIKHHPLIAASIGPYGAYLADGSEYRGDYGTSDEELKAFHRERMQLLDQSAADVLACETIPSHREAMVLASMLKTISTPAWVCFSCRDGHHLNDGTPIEKSASHFKTHPNVFAVGINCTRPEYITSLIRSIRPLIGDKKIIVYPNSGETYQPDNKQWSGSTASSAYVAQVKQWIQEGADLVGGCCRVGADQIHEVSNSLFGGK